jgi:acetylornithine/succinyldiaminopimelate/putrescine aminotransferase
MIESDMKIVSASGDFLVDESGKQYFDLCMGYGSVSLGHNYRDLVSSQIKQLQTYASPGFADSAIYAKAKCAVEAFVPGYNLHGFYTSGTNSAEIAIKMAIATSGKAKIISFAKSMHGKTLFANKLGFDSFLEDAGQIMKIPFVADLPEDEVLNNCKRIMQQGNVAAIIVEPIQMSGGGAMASPSFYHQLQELAISFDVIVIYDEILTGFYRTGQPFFFRTHNVAPDIVLTGKAMGGGVPVSAILQKQGFEPANHFRGGGTYFNHPLACASVTAILKAFQKLDVAVHIQSIQNCILQHLPSESLSGMGALWNIDLKTTDNANAVEKNFCQKKSSSVTTTGIFAFSLAIRSI